MLPPVMVIPVAMTKSCRSSHARRNVLTTSCSGADSIEESFFQAARWLDIFGQHGIILKPSKFSFVQDAVEFAGLDITLDSVRPCHRLIQEIMEFPTPTNITDIRSWFGVVNQVSYAFSVAEKMLPFRQLLQPGSSFMWDDKLDKAFQEL